MKTLQNRPAEVESYDLPFPPIRTRYHIEGHFGSLSSDVNDLIGFSRVPSRF